MGRAPRFASSVELDRVERDVLVGRRQVAPAVDARGRRSEHCIFHHRRILPYHGVAVHQRIWPQGQTRRDRRRPGHHHPGDVGSGGYRLVGGAVRARSPFHESGPHDRARQRYRSHSRANRVQITSASILAAKKDAIARYMKAYNETVDWMYSSPEAVPRYLAFSGLAEPAVRLMLREFIPRESLQTEKIMGLGES